MQTNPNLLDSQVAEIYGKGASILERAWETRDIVAFRQLLAHPQIDPNLPDIITNTPLMHIIVDRSAEEDIKLPFIKALLHHKMIDAKKVDSDGSTALQLARGDDDLPRQKKNC